MKEMKPIIVEQIYNTSIENVWKAVTEIEQMRQWYFENIPDFRPEVGFSTKFEIINEDRVFPHLWKITRVIPGKLLEYNWKYEGYTGEAVVIFELFEENKFTKLKLTNIVVENFPDNIPEFKRESCERGWNYFICESLKKFLKKMNNIMHSAPAGRV